MLQFTIFFLENIWFKTNAQRLVTANSDVCGTENCKEVADDLNKYLNWTMDPCEDFYGLVCNKFLDEEKSKLETQSSGMSFFISIKCEKDDLFALECDTHF